MNKRKHPFRGECNQEKRNRLEAVLLYRGYNRKRFHLRFDGLIHLFLLLRNLIFGENFFFDKKLCECVYARPDHHVNRACRAYLWGSPIEKLNIFWHCYLLVITL